MRQFRKVTKVAGLALGAGLLATTVNVPAQAHGKGQEVKITVDENGYMPSTVKVKAGQEVHLTFVSKGGGCANGVSIPALKKTFALKKGAKKTISFKPKKGQTIGFACSMKMFKGKVVAE